jgi:hypothetical protein
MNLVSRKLKKRDKFIHQYFFFGVLDNQIKKVFGGVSTGIFLKLKLFFKN